MFKRNWVPLFGAAFALPLVLAGGGCSADLAKENGSCVVNVSLDCGVDGPDGSDLPAGLTGYSCDGTARPDDGAKYYDGVPQGSICSDNGTLPDGKRNYCCTPPTTHCAYNPVSTCTDQNSAGYQCRGSTRPDAYNPALLCGNGVEDGDYIDFCCSHETLPPSQSCTALGKGGDCGTSQLTPFTCPGTQLPRAELFGTSESRADYYRPLCSIPQIPPNPNQHNYCCYMPALIPVGGSCVQDTAVPGCAAGKFGFACYGPENPHDDYLPMQCHSPGVAGKSAEGYPATLYCCDFVATADASTISN